MKLNTKFLTNDILVSGISAFIILTFSILLYADFNRKLDAGNAKQIGTITFKREVAQRKYLAQVVWEGIDQNYPVYDNDSIRTSDMSEAVIHLLDGTDISIEENTMIMLSTFGDGININFEQGSISANRAGVQGTDIAAINIKSQDATVSIDKSNIQLTQLGNKELDLTVSDGTAKVKSGAEETLIKSNEKALISSDRKETRVVQLKFSLNEPASNRYFITESQKSEVSFAWDLAGNFKNITWEISKDRLFKKIISSQRQLTKNTLKISLEAGVYYWRITAINEDSKQLESSETGKFNIVSRKPIKIISPQPDEIIKHSLSQNSVTFKWGEDSLAADYTLEISQDKDFAAVINKVNTPLKSITVDNLVQGNYFWRINSNINIGGEQIVKTGSTSSFKIDKIKVINPPVLISPGKGEKIDASIARSKGIVLSWNNDPSFSSYEVEVSRDANFQNEVIDQKRKVNFAEIKNELPSGRYFWRVEGLVANGEKIPYSSVGEFEIVINESLTLLAPAADEKITIPARSRKQDVVFSWKKVDLSGSYKLQVSQKSDFSDAKAVIAKDQNSATVAINEAGEYYWRVILTDSKNKEIIKSNSYKFVVTAEEVIPETKTFLIVKSPVKGGKIYIDSKFKGYTEFKQEVRPDSNISVRIIASGFNDFSSQVSVKSGDTFTLSPAMERSKKLNRVKWVSPLSLPLLSAPVYYQNKIVLCSENGYIIIMNNSGTVLLSKKIAKRFGSKPAVFENNIYAADVDGFLYSIDSSDGKLNWKVKTGGPLLFKSEVVVSENKIFVATGFGIVEAYDLKGKKIWKNNLNESIYNSLMAVKNSLIVATDGMKLYSLNSKDGKKNWSTPIDERVITLTPFVYKDIIYFGCYSGTFYAVSLDDGDVLWQYKSGGAIYSSPAVVDGNVFFGSEDGSVYSLNGKTGSVNWQFKSNYPIQNSLIYAFESIVVVSEKTVYSLNPLNGEILWQNSFNNRIRTSPTFADDTVIMGLVNGDIVSVRNNLIEIAQ